MNETVNATIKQKYGAFVRSRRWWKQFRKLVINCVVHNLERGLDITRRFGGIGRRSLRDSDGVVVAPSGTEELLGLQRHRWTGWNGIPFKRAAS